MQSRASTRVHAFGITAALTVLAGGCSLDDRSVRESDVMDAADAAPRPGYYDDGSEDGGRIVSPQPRRDAGTAAGEGSAGEDGSGEGGSGGAAQPPAGGDGASGSGGDTSDDDGGIPPDADAPDAGCTLGNALLPTAGWVDRATNCAGIQGGVRVDWRDDSFVQVTLDTTDICAEGYSGEVEPSPFDVSFALNLNEEKRNGSVVNDYDAELNGVVGFEFVVEPPSPQPYFGVISEGVLYCTPITDLGMYRVRLIDLHAECWNGNGGPTPNPRKLRSIGFYSGTSEATSFQFCVTDIVALTAFD